MKKYRLGEIAEVIGGVTFNKADIATSGIRILRGGNIQNGEICLKEDDVYLPHIYKDNKNTILEGDTILVASTGSMEVLGKAATAFSSLGEVQIGAFLRIIRPKKTKYAALISAHLQSSQFREYIQKQAKGTSINNIRNEYLINFLLYVPNEDSLVDFSAFYHTIHRKIALNRAINHNLEAMAKQLYDYWFVQFDFPNEEGKPYKSSGGKMVWNEKLKREIPQGWEVCPINNRLEIKSGFPFKSDTYKTFGRYKVITIKNVQDGELVTSGCDYVDEIPSRANDYISLKLGDRLISLTGNCGRLCVVCEENLLLNQRVGLLYCDAIYLEYFYNFLNSNSMRMMVANLANGAAQANLSPVELCKTDCYIPDYNILCKYNRKANTIRKAIIQNKHEIFMLIRQRDELLPLLMNGQVSVNYDLSHD